MLNIIASRTVRIVLIGNNLALWLFSAAARSDTDTGSPPFTLVANFNGTAPLEGILNQPRPTFAVKIIIVMSPTHIILQALSVLNILFLRNTRKYVPTLLATGKSMVDCDLSSPLF